MKLLLGFILSLLFLFGCGEKKEEKAPVKTSENNLTPDTSDIATTPVEDQNQTFHMRYNFILNKDYKYSISTLTENTETMRTDTTITLHAKQNITYLLDIKPVEIDKDSITKFVCNFYSVKIDANVKGHKFSYQSGVTTDSLSKARFAEYESSVNNPFNITVNRTGDVIDITKTDKILSKFLALKNIPDTLRSQQKDKINKQVIQRGLRPLVSQVFRKIPENSLAKDSVWTYKQSPYSLVVFQVSATNIYKISSLQDYMNDRLAVIDASIETKISGKNEVSEQGFTYNFDKPVTEATGKIYFNIDKGYLQKSKVKTRLIISYTMKSNKPGGKGSGPRTEVSENTNIVELL